MHKLPITAAVRKIANEYAQNMLPDPATGDVKFDFKSDVQWLLKQLKIGTAHVRKTVGKKKKDMNKTEQKPYVEYLEKIIAEYPNLLICEPGSPLWERLEKVFGSLLGKQGLAESIRYKVKNPQKGKKDTKTEPFHDTIVNVMGYAKVQKQIFPPIMEEHHVKTCVYCNAQFAIAADDTTALFQLDHCWPKSVYPYLCTCFFNLQPACGSCNQRKSKSDLRTGANKEYTLSIWQSPTDPVKGDMYHFHIDDANLATYLLATSAHKKELLEMKYIGRSMATIEEKELLDKIEERFHITDQYNKQLDIVEETVWRHQIYSHGYIRSLNNAMGKLFPDMKNQIRRLITGTYDGEDNMYRRPLTKMIHDVCDQLDRIKKP